MGNTYSFPYTGYTGGQLAGYRLDYATVLPPGTGGPHYVRSTGAQAYDPPELAGRIFLTIDAALAQCRSGAGDVVMVMPGHVESYAAAFWPSLVAGTRIVGMGYGNFRPVITLTAAASNCAISVANVMVDNIKFTTSTSAQVTTAFTCTAAGVTFVNCEFEIGKSVTDAIATTFSLAAGCKDSAFVFNYVYSTTDAAVTTFITTTGAVDRLKIIGNHIMAGVVTAATGVLLDLSNAAIVNNIIVDNLLWNNTASSKFVIKPHASSTGWVDNNRFGSGDAGTAPASSGFSTYTTGYRFGINQAITTTGASALLSPAVDS
jgi:hypothetical protein